ncbi:TonB-dependent receptor [Geoalkalibacter subterraneus]|uniref:TonB-dependent receptor n=1 Tax=Geoalkalibacter subterraneus TaxID=483547 RepID=UPI00069497CE|nr:TonB-dependent receptor [Geoalkalibacter subterraneus]
MYHYALEWFVVLPFFFLFLLHPCHVFAEQSTALPTLSVVGQKLIIPTRQASETVYTGSEITRDGIRLQGERASTSVHEALNLLPGVNLSSSDGYGLAAEQNDLRIRGVPGRLGAMTVEGVPNYGGNPIGPRDYLYDMENIEAISVYKGAVPGDIGTGVGSRGGAIVLHPLWPQKDAGLQFKQSLGSHSYNRTFGRLDSGELLETQTRLSGSYSYTDADKWRGPGELGPRHNTNLGLAQPLGEHAEVKLWYNHNDLDQHLYRPLNFEEIRNLDDNYRKDFNEELSGNPTEDVYYYQYNRGSYRNRDLISTLTFDPSDVLHVSVKPFYSKEDTRVLQGNPAKGALVQQRNREIERKGVIAEVRADLPGIQTVAGHHFESLDMDIFSRNFAVTPDGLDYRGMGILASGGTSYINSPYLKFSGGSGSFNWQAGLKYFHFEDAAADGYVTGSGPDFDLKPAADLSRSETTYDIWLPTLGASFDLNPSLSIYASYGKNFIRPYAYMPLVNLYNTHRETFQGQEITLQKLFDGYAMERSHTVDLGARYLGEWFDLAPTLFFARHKNLLTTVYDPRVGLNYQQNVGEATGYGIDLEANLYPAENITLFCNLTYTVLTYDDDLTFAGRRVDADGRQVVATPREQLRAGIIWTPGHFEISPMLRYIGERYADMEHRQRVSSYTVFDLRGSYTFHNPGIGEQIRISLELNNLFDRRYTAVIDELDASLAGATTFYPGAPMTTILTASIQF